MSDILRDKYTDRQGLVKGGPILTFTQNSPGGPAARMEERERRWGHLLWRQRLRHQRRTDPGSLLPEPAALRCSVHGLVWA